MTTEKSLDLKKLVPWILYLLFFAVLNETVFNVATTSVLAQFHLTKSEVSWLMTIFMVFFGIGAVIYGKLADIFSVRNLIFVGVSIYAAGSIFGFIVQASYPLVIAARAIQGIGCSALPALVFVVVARYFAESERGKMFGLLTTTVSASIVVGPLLGGLVANYLGWPILFLIPIATLVALPFFAKTLPKEERRPGTIDLLGAVLIAATIGSLVLFLNFTEWYFGVGFVVLLALFLWRTFSAKEPFIKPELFKIVKFRVGVIVSFCLFSVVLGLMFLVPLMLQNLYSFAPAMIGYIIAPGAIASAIVGPLAGNLADRKGNSYVVALGLIFLIASMIVMSILLALSPIAIAAAMILTFIGFSFFQTAVVNAVSQSLPQEDAGVGMGIFNMVGIVSGALGTAIVGKVLDARSLEFRVIPMDGALVGSAYSNLMLIFAVITLVGGVLYLRAFRGSAPMAQGMNAHSAPTSSEVLKQDPSES